MENMEDFLDETLEKAALMLAAGSYRSNKTAKAAAWTSAALLAGAWSKKTYRSWIEQKSWTISINQTDPLYLKVSAWLHQILPENAGTGIQLQSDLQDPSYLYQNIILETPQKIRYNNTTITVHTEEEQGASNTNTGRGGKNKLVFSGQDTFSKKIVLAKLKTLAETRTVPQLFISDRWGSWTLRGFLPQRDPNTVILADKENSRIRADLQKFLSSEETYTKLGIPWHRGYLLYGPAGTGKTSLALALAKETNRDIYYLSLADLDKDSSLLELIYATSTHSILLIEDVDIIHAAKSRDNAEATGVTLAGLLNALDGVGTPHGLITIMTTNNKDDLDDALIRAGRVDYSLELGYATTEQLHKLVKTFCNATLPENIEVKPETTSADILECVKRNLHHPDQAVDTIIKNYTIQ